MQGWGENSLLLARVVKQGSRLPGEAAELSQKNTGQQLSGTAQVQLISPKGRKNGPADLLRCHPALIIRCNATQHGFYATVKARIKAGRRNVGCLARCHPCSREKAQHILLSTAVSVLCRKITQKNGKCHRNAKNVYLG